MCEKIVVEDLVRSGVLLVEIVNGSNYSAELKTEAQERMRLNVLSVQAGRFQVGS